MYSRDRDGRKDRKTDIGRLWRSLRRDDERFSDSLLWFARKAIESDMHRKFEIMFSAYLSLMSKLDDKVFLGSTFLGIISGRTDRIHTLLVQNGYGDSIAELALGAAVLYEQTGHKNHNVRAAELREIAEWYRVRLESHREKYYGDGVDRRDCWHFIRISNRVFTVIFDMVKDGTVGGRSRIDTYFKCLEGLTDDEELNKLYDDALLRLINPRGYRWKRLVSRFKPARKAKKAKIRTVEQKEE